MDTEAIRRANEWLKEVYASQPERDVPPLHHLWKGGQAPLHRGGPGRERPRARHRLSGRVSLHPRRLPLDVPRAALDDAPVRRLRNRRGDEQALPLPARPRPDRPLDGVRHADAMGHDPDHPRSLGEVGARASRSTRSRDMETLFSGIPLGEVTVSMTVSGPAAMLLALYVCVAEKQGVQRDKLGGTIQTDILKEYIAQKEWCFPIDPAMRLVIDMIEFCAQEMPRWHPVSISGYHIREAGIDRTAGAGLHARRRARLRSGRPSTAGSTSTTSHRGCRSSSTRTSTSSRRSPSTAPRAASGPARCARPSARATRPRGGCASTGQTAGVSLTAQQPHNNIVRTSLEALVRRARRHPEPCTPTPMTRHSPCRRRRRCGSRCERSR